MSRTRRHKGNSLTETTNYWQSYSDLMGGLVAVFILLAAVILMLAVHLQNSLNQERKQNETQTDNSTILSEKVQQLGEELENLHEDVQTIREKLRDLQEHTDRIAIAEALLREFEEYGVLVDKETGDVTLEQDITFEQDGNQLTEEGRICLDRILPIYINILMSSEYRDQLSQVIIEGHTSSAGRYMYNLKLGQERAYAVADYFLNEDTGSPFEEISNETLAEFRTYVTVNSRSESELIYDENGEEDEAASRRVVIKYRLKSDEISDTIETMTEGLEPLDEKIDATENLAEEILILIDNPQ